LNESILIEQAKQGDEASFRKIVETWEDMVFNTALGFVQQPEDAEDVAQDVFVQVYQSIRSFKGESKFSTWLYRITVSKSLDHLRKKKRKKRFAQIKSLFGDKNEVLEQLPEFYHPGIALENKEKAAILFQSLRQLPENQRVAFSLHKIEGLSYQEISEIMEVTVPAVESLMHRAKLNLRKTLEIYYSRLK
jgi:RNA polymerase sigma factor (sigma-70 family)